MRGGIFILTGKVYKMKHKGNYVIVDLSYLKRTDLSLKAKGLLTQILSLPENWDFSERGLISICAESKTAITNTLKELKDKKYFKKIKRRNTKGQYCYDYIFFENPKLYEEFMQNPVLELLSMDNP